MRNLLKLTVPSTDESSSWLAELNNEERGLQLQSKVIPEAGLWLASHGDTRSNSGEISEIRIAFVYKDYELAKGEFIKAVQETKPPHGTRLVHVIYKPDDASFDFETLEEW